MIYFSTHKTIIGEIAFAWDEQGLLRMQLPYSRKADTIEKLFSYFDDEVLPAKDTAWIKKMRKQLDNYFNQKEASFKDIPLSLKQVTPFRKKVYKKLQNIKRGKTISYGDLALRCGSPHGARAIGGAMAKNPIPIIIPCHRVLAANKKMGGFTSPRGIETKIELLNLEN